ncbi:hypothetical protein GFS60_00137 [Rhodococcus sp. WAY2]|nr:hypothetical protein GFS60_00137 [Rhodococcus sp. WAY2]
MRSALRRTEASKLDLVDLRRNRLSRQVLPGAGGALACGGDRDLYRCV